MSTLTRKLAVVCLAVVFSVLVHGCGGGGSKLTPMSMSHTVSTDMVTTGLTIEPGTYTIQPGGNLDAGDATFTCPPGGVPCVVTVADDGTVTSAGGAATAMNSAAGNAKRYTSNPPVDTSMVVAGLIIRPGMYTIEPGGEMDLYDATFTCPAGGLPCMVKVDLNADGTNTVTSAGGMATAMISATGTMKLTASGSVDMSMVTAGLTEITAGTYTIQPGSNMDVGDATFTCPAGGVRCVVTVTADVDADGEETGTNTVTFVGGTAKATDSAAGRTKLAVSNPNIYITGLATGYTTITPGTYTIQPGGDMDVGEANFQCPAGGVPCVVTVTVVANADGTSATTTVTSAGATATVRNSMAVMTTRAAIALNTPSTGALNRQSDAELEEISVERSTDGITTTVALMPQDTDTIGYTRKAVDTGHEINGWIGQTLTRGDGTDGLAIPEEATVYTNIEPSTPQKLKYEGTGDDAVPAPGNLFVFVLDAGQGNDGSLNMEKENMARKFRGAYGDASGTFTCAADATCTAIETDTNAGGQRVLTNQLSGGWTFESDGFVESEAIQNQDYMYFGYWLRSPTDPSVANPAYQFSAFFGGGTGAEFQVPGVLTDADDALTATYKGGAAGRYVTRKLSFTNQGVDPKSPAYHGRFTANAELKAYFGAHPSFAAIEGTDRVGERPNSQNRIHGTITDFKDDDTDLGFEVTLGRQPMGTGAIASVANSATAKFSNTPTNTAATGMGTWNAQFYGPAADTDAMESANTKLPSGVAGQFNVGSAHTNVVGAFAAEIQ